MPAGTGGTGGMGVTGGMGGHGGDIGNIKVGHSPVAVREEPGAPVPCGHAAHGEHGRYGGMERMR